MNDLDEKILAAIKAETEESLGELSQELGLFGLVAESFKGALRWVVIASFVLILTFLALAIYCAVFFLHADDLMIKFNWFAGMLLSFIVVTILRLWFFMELNRVSTRRDVKRVELQVTLLANKVDQLKASTE